MYPHFRIIRIQERHRKLLKYSIVGFELKAIMLDIRSNISFRKLFAEIFN